jgi:predicted ribosome quality control (RQC) complex YloA/Tae2 family protein
MQRADRLQRLTAVRDRIDEVREIEEAEELEGEARSVLGHRTNRSSNGPQRAVPYRTFHVLGHDVLVGKHARGNDELTQRIARPEDLWFHARGTSGSHVVLRWDKNRDNPGPELIERVASIAAWYSGAKHSGLVPVAWTRKKYVRKPKGAAPGAVVMTREEVVIVEPRLPGKHDDDD